jgi:hypothetical protein
VAKENSSADEVHRWIASKGDSLGPSSLPWFAPWLLVLKGSRPRSGYQDDWRATAER